jgi:hypothetical protein
MHTLDASMPGGDRTWQTGGDSGVVHVAPLVALLLGLLG